MRKSRATNITSMPESIEDERRARMRKYAIMMGIRTACFVALIWVRGPWMLVFAAGAILLPYFAVVIANAASTLRSRGVERPSSITPLPPTDDLHATEDVGATEDFRATESLYPPEEWFNEGENPPKRQAS